MMQMISVSLAYKDANIFAFDYNFRHTNTELFLFKNANKHQVSSTSEHA